MIFDGGMTQRRAAQAGRLRPRFFYLEADIGSVFGWRCIRQQFWCVNRDLSFRVARGALRGGGVGPGSGYQQVLALVVAYCVFAIDATGYCLLCRLGDGLRRGSFSVHTCGECENRAGDQSCAESDRVNLSHGCI